MVLVVLAPALICSFELLDMALIPRFLLLGFFAICFLLFEIFKKGLTEKKTMIRITPIRVLLAMWAVATVVSGISAALMGEYLFEAARICLYLLLFVLLVQLLEKGLNEKLFLKATVLLAIGLCSIGISQFYRYEAFVTIHGMAKVTGLMTNKNLFSEYLAMVLPFVILAFFILRSYWKWLSALALIGSSIFISILLARSAWVALFISGTFILIFYSHLSL